MQTYGDIRLKWDPFISKQYLMDSATEPGKGVQTYTKSRHGVSMITEYVSYKPPTQVGMKLVNGPWFFDSFGGGWSFKEIDENTTLATWRYTFKTKRAISFIADPIGKKLLQSDIEKRIAAYKEACVNEEIVAYVVNCKS